MKEINSDVEITQEDIFDSIASSLPRELADDEMTIDRFAAKYKVSYEAANAALEEAYRKGKLRKEKRYRMNPEVGQGRNVNIYIPVANTSEKE